MGCKCGSKKGQLTEEQEKILKAVAQADGPVATKDIAEATGIPSKSVSCRISALKKKGFLESPARCKYQITDAGKQAIGA